MLDRARSQALRSLPTDTRELSRLVGRGVLTLQDLSPYQVEEVADHLHLTLQWSTWIIWQEPAIFEDYLGQTRSTTIEAERRFGPVDWDFKTIIQKFMSLNGIAPSFDAVHRLAPDGECLYTIDAQDLYPLLEWLASSYHNIVITDSLFLFLEDLIEAHPNDYDRRLRARYVYWLRRLHHPRT